MLAVPTSNVSSVVRLMRDLDRARQSQLRVLLNKRSREHAIQSSPRIETNSQCDPECCRQIPVILNSEGRAFVFSRGPALKV